MVRASLACGDLVVGCWPAFRFSHGSFLGALRFNRLGVAVASVLRARGLRYREGIYEYGVHVC